METFSSNRRFVALGDLVADYYYKDNNLLSVDGGSSKFNCLVGLSHLGNHTAVISACSSSKIGEMLITGLNNQRVDTRDVLQLQCESRIYHLIRDSGGNYKSSKICPFCGQISWYFPSIANMNYCIPKLSPSDIIIFDNLKPEDMDLIRNTTNEKVIDIGRTNTLNLLEAKTIILALCSRFEIIQLNETVEKYLLERFNFTAVSQLYSFLRPKMLIVTKGKNGAEVIYNSKSYRKKPPNVVKNEVDTTGAGDAFFSVFIHEYYSSRKNITAMLDSAFEKAGKITPCVVSATGARGYIYQAFTPIPKPGVCTCTDFLDFS